MTGTPGDPHAPSGSEAKQEAGGPTPREPGTHETHRPWPHTSGQTTLARLDIRGYTDATRARNSRRAALSPASKSAAHRDRGAAHTPRGPPILAIRSYRSAAANTASALSA